MSAGHTILTLVTGATVVGGFPVGCNRAHLFNPIWPPHLRLPGAQTISKGAVLGSTGLRARRQADTGIPLGGLGCRLARRRTG